MLTFKFPTNVELSMMTQAYVIDRSRLKGQTIVPFKNTLAQKVQWDELDNERGMTAPHQQDNDPKIVERPGSKVREYTPIFFKESELIKESEILNARAFGTLGGVINLDDLVATRLKARIDKDFIRAEWLIWSMLQGNISIDENGVKVDEDFDVQTYTPLVSWATHSTSTPLADARAIALQYRGSGATGGGATIYLNQTDMNHVLANKNDDDFFGFVNSNFKKTTYSMDELNAMLRANGLPVFEVYDEGYIDSNGTFQTFIKDGYPVTVGRRPQTIGNFMLTPSLHNDSSGMPAGGFFSMIEVNGQKSTGSVNLSDLGSSSNPKIKITTGFYGGPTLYYPKTILDINAYRAGV